MKISYAINHSHRTCSNKPKIHFYCEHCRKEQDPFVLYAFYDTGIARSRTKKKWLSLARFVVRINNNDLDNMNTTSSKIPNILRTKLCNCDERPLTFAIARLKKAAQDREAKRS